MQSEQINLRVNRSRKEQIQKWARRRGLTVASLINASLNYYVGMLPAEGYTDEAALAKRLTERETRERQQQTAEVSLVCETGDTSAATTPDLDARRVDHDTTK